MIQVTLGAGPDLLPIPDPGEKGFYYVNGRSSGFLTAYYVRSKEIRGHRFRDCHPSRASRPPKSWAVQHLLGWQRLRLLARSFHIRLRAPRRPTRSVFPKPKINRALSNDSPPPR